MLAFRSLDTFPPLREPDRRRRDEELPIRSKQGTGNKPKNHLTEKLPYKSANHRFLSGTDPIQNLRYRQPGRTTVRLALYGTSNEYRGGGFGEGFELPTGIMRIGDLVPPSSSLRPSLLADEIGELFACHFSGHKQKHRRY